MLKAQGHLKLAAKQQQKSFRKRVQRYQGQCDDYHLFAFS